MEQINIIDIVDYIDQIMSNTKNIDQSNKDHDYEEKELHKSYLNFQKFNLLKGTIR